MNARASQELPRPVALKKEGSDLLLISWNDDHQSRYSWLHLRSHCPCATCKEEREKPPDPFRILRPEEISRGPLQAVAMTPLGHYAYKIAFSDGHDTGIYSFEALRALCQCEQCGRSP